MALKDGLLAEFDHEMGTTRRLLERVPDGSLGWKPHDKSRSMAGLATHLASLPHWASVILTSDAFDLSAAPRAQSDKASSAAILEAFDAETKQSRPLLDKTDAELTARWTLRRNGQEIFTMPRIAAFRTFVLYHSVHHRGQLSVYLRLNGIDVPAIYGPSADEG